MVKLWKWPIGERGEKTLYEYVKKKGKNKGKGRTLGMWKTSHQYFIKMTEIFGNYDVYTGFYRIKNKFSITSIFKKKIRKFFGWKAGLKFFLETKVKYSRLKTGHWKLPSTFLDGKLGWWSFYVWPIVHLPRLLDQKPATWPTSVRVSFERYWTSIKHPSLAQAP